MDFRNGNEHFSDDESGGADENANVDENANINENGGSGDRTRLPKMSFAMLFRIARYLFGRRGAGRSRNLLETEDMGENVDVDSDGGGPLSGKGRFRFFRTSWKVSRPRSAATSPEVAPDDGNGNGNGNPYHKKGWSRKWLKFIATLSKFFPRLVEFIKGLAGCFSVVSSIAQVINMGIAISQLKSLKANLACVIAVAVACGVCCLCWLIYYICSPCSRHDDLAVGMRIAARSLDEDSVTVSLHTFNEQDDARDEITLQPQEVTGARLTVLKTGADKEEVNYGYVRLEEVVCNMGRLDCVDLKRFEGWEGGAPVCPAEVLLDFYLKMSNAKIASKIFDEAITGITRVENFGSKTRDALLYSRYNTHDKRDCILVNSGEDAYSVGKMLCIQIVDRPF